MPTSQKTANQMHWSLVGGQPKATSHGDIGMLQKYLTQVNSNLHSSQPQCAPIPCSGGASESRRTSLTKPVVLAATSAAIAQPTPASSEKIGAKEKIYDSPCVTSSSPAIRGTSSTVTTIPTAATSAKQKPRTETVTVEIPTATSGPRDGN